ncbi:MAG: sugar phosphate nucleotidyltransferase [Lachnospiraceae bacterium]|nr:sugar phosphate nucleotidyltransferase [Lachnospiraceae bacterium]
MKKQVDLFVPGRLCLFGEHSDWAGTNKTFNAGIVPGRAIVTGTEQGIYGTATPSENFAVYSDISEYKGDSFECPMDLKLLRDTANKGGFFSYVAGVASYICEWYHTGGIELHITKMDLPMKSGLSSSAAICVLVAKAFNELYDLRLNTMGLMNIAYWGELRTPSRCGRLDQACAFGVAPVALNFDGNEIDVERITLKAPMHYVFADLMAGKDTVKILADLNSAYPFPRSEEDKRLHEALGKDNRELTERAIKYMSEGNVEAIGALMVEAQKLFDEKVAPMSTELIAPVLHKTLNDENIKKLTYGGKGVGSQGDGTIQFLAKDEETQKELIDYLQNTLGMTAYPLSLRPKASVKKAIIPVAGFGTRLYPLTRGVKKEFCPVIDKDGLMKPAILVLLEELDDIEIEEICMILNRDEQQYYEDFFFKSLPREHFEKLSPAMQKYEKRIEKLSRKLKFVYQDEQKGFGHAVYQAKDFAAGEPVLLLLGDTIYQSNNGIPCTKQLIDTYEKYGATTIALHTVPVDLVGNFGIFAGEWEDKDEEVLKLDRIAEKPNKIQAKEQLCVSSRKSPENYYAAFGSYVLRPDVFDRLDTAIRENIVNAKGEIELTDALAYVCDNFGAYGAVINGASFDLGNPDAYRRTVESFGK